ncbi:DUF4232 domain-containing protein [Streptomyces sp. NPDC059788]|uniref:DUF4232 domain-containing protein n=1 Tax=Streptomyces sp. NPDC059788 TaxID=3346948 RepID=UPI00365E2EAD
MSSSATTRTVRRRTLRVAAAALTAVAGLTLTACSGSDGASGTKAAAHMDAGSAAAGSEGAGSSAAAQGSEPEAGSEARTGSGAKAEAKAGAPGKQSGSSSGGRGGKAGSGVERCHTSNLTAAFATGEDATPDPDAGGSTTTSIVLTNKSSRTCKIGGFAGVDLTSENGGQRWSLTRSSAKHGSITLGPGDSTDFTVNLGMAKDDEGSYQPAHAVVTPPNETTSLTLKWPWGPLVHQDGATHPATFVNPIG